MDKAAEKSPPRNRHPKELKDRAMRMGGEL